MMSIGEYRSRAASRSAISVSRRPWMIACFSRSSTVSPSDCPFFALGLLVRVVLDEHLQRVFDAVAGRVERPLVEQQPAAQFLALLVDATPAA